MCRSSFPPYSWPTHCEDTLGDRAVDDVGGSVGPNGQRSVAPGTRGGVRQGRPGVIRQTAAALLVARSRTSSCGSPGVTPQMIFTGRWSA